MGGGVQHDLEGELERLLEEEEKRPAYTFRTSTESSSADIQSQPPGAVASLEFPDAVPIQLSVNLHHQSSTLASIACNESNVSTPSIAGPNTEEVISNVCNTESGTNDDSNLTRHLAAVTKDSQSIDLLDRNRDIASTLDVLRHYFERGDIANENKHDADNLGLLTQKILSQNKLLRELIHTIRDKREKIRSYKPGDGLYEVGGVSRMDVAIPDKTTLLLVGPSGAGKSTLINNIIRVLNNSTCGFDRAQAYEEKGNGSLFLQEYMVDRSTRFSVFDSRGFSESHVSEDLGVVRKWMADGICHGEAVCRPSDNASSKEALEGRSRQRHAQFTSNREVNFVIFVVNALSVHKWKESQDMRAIENLVALYKSPFLTFKDDRPVAVMTHGDKLSRENRILTRILIGKVFGVSPLDQVFDISCCTERFVNAGDGDPVRDLVLLNMLDFALARADRNLRYKNSGFVQAYPAVMDHCSNVQNSPKTMNHSAKSQFAKVRYMAYRAVIDHWNNVDNNVKIVLIAILIFWLVCFAMLLAAPYSNHKQNPWRSLRFFGVKKSMDWLKNGSKSARFHHKRVHGI